MRLFGFVCVVALGAALLAVPTLARRSAQAPRTPSRPPAPTPDATPKPDGSSGSVHTGLIDINAATESELGTLPGIGRARAEAIVASRPYRSKDELLRRKIVPANVYDAIRNRIVARQS